LVKPAANFAVRGAWHKAEDCGGIAQFRWGKGSIAQFRWGKGSLY